MSAPSFYYTLVSESYSLFPYRYRYSFGNVCTLLLLNSCLRILLAVSVPVLLFHCLGTLFVLSLYSLFTLFVLSLYCRCTIVYYLRTSDIRYSLCTITVPVLSKCIPYIVLFLPFVYYRCTIFVLSLCFRRTSHQYLCTTHVLSLHQNCTTCVLSIYLCTAFALSLHYICTVVALPVYYLSTIQYTVHVLPSQCLCTPVVLPLYSLCTIAVFSLYYRCILYHC